jgi:hypothetical protein
MGLFMMPPLDSVRVVVQEMEFDPQPWDDDTHGATAALASDTREPYALS